MARIDRILKFKPQKLSVLLMAVVAVVAFAGQQMSPKIGYYLALLAMLSIIAASFTDSFWPSKQKAENPFVFGLFWGLMLGLLLPFVLSKYWPG